MSEEDAMLSPGNQDIEQVLQDTQVTFSARETLMIVSRLHTIVGDLHQEWDRPLSPKQDHIITSIFAASEQIRKKHEQAMTGGKHV